MPRRRDRGGECIEDAGLVELQCARPAVAVHAELQGDGRIERALGLLAGLPFEVQPGRVASASAQGASASATSTVRSARGRRAWPRLAQQGGHGGQVQAEAAGVRPEAEAVDVQRRQRGRAGAGVVYPPQYDVAAADVQGQGHGAAVVQAVEGAREPAVQARQAGAWPRLRDGVALRRGAQAVGGRVGEVHGVAASVGRLGGRVGVRVAKPGGRWKVRRIVAMRETALSMRRRA